MLRAGAHQGVEVGRPSRRLVGAGKQIVLATEGNVAELLFTDIVVQAHAAVVDEASQRPPMIHPVRRGLRQVCARRLVGGRDQEPPVRLIQDGLRPCAPQVDPPLGGRARASAICSRRYKPAMSFKGYATRQSTSCKATNCGARAPSTRARPLRPPGR